MNNGEKKIMGIKKIPEKVEITCDVCGVMCDKKNRKQSGIITFAADGLDFAGMPVGNAGFKLYVCDTCLHKSQEAIEALKK